MSTLRRRVLLFGATGQVGAELAQLYSGHDLIALDRSSADLSKPESLRAVVRSARPEVILNAAAYTAVDRAETEQELADLVNHRAPAVLAEEAERLGSLLVHYSTDYVFDGSGSAPWLEMDAPAPLNIYGEGKLAGEIAITRECRSHLILRTSWVYGTHGQNFLKTMLRLGRERAQVRVVDDQWGAPTPATLLAAATRGMVDKVLDSAMGSAGDWAGIYHVSCGGRTNWCEFAKAIYADARARDSRAWPEVQGIPSREYPTPARRPHNSVLCNDKVAAKFGVRLPAWRSALAEISAAMELCKGTTEMSLKSVGCA